MRTAGWRRWILLAVFAAPAAGAAQVSRERGLPPGSTLSFEDRFVRIVRRVTPPDSQRLGGFHYDPLRQFFWLRQGELELGINFPESRLNVRNLCDTVVEAGERECPASDRNPQPGVTRIPAFRVDDYQVDAVVVRPSSAFSGDEGAKPPWIVAIDEVESTTEIVYRAPIRGVPIGVGSKKHLKGSVFVPPVGRNWSISNQGTSPARLIVITRP